MSCATEHSTLFCAYEVYQLHFTYFRANYYIIYCGGHVYKYNYVWSVANAGMSNDREGRRKLGVGPICLNFLDFHLSVSEFHESLCIEVTIVSGWRYGQSRCYVTVNWMPACGRQERARIGNLNFHKLVLFYKSSGLPAGLSINDLL
jgi:hypothetical protein